MREPSTARAALSRVKRWAAPRVPDRTRRLAADVGFVLEVPLARLSIDTHRTPLQPGDVDAEQLRRSVEPDAHARRADEYFGAGLEGEPLASRRAAHLAKPFHDPTEAAQHLGAFSSLLLGLDLAPGMTVLDFGCGAGWTSRLLMQLGCRVVLCDVSPAALDTARAGLESHPPLMPSDTPEPQFLNFDGRHLELPDASVDRVVCFDVFHHVPNQGEVLHELARVLTPEGVAGFHEPGPDHSRKPASQFEMRHHGFLERDLLLGPIWEEAHRAGFERLTLTLDPPPVGGFDLRRYQRVLRFGIVPWTVRRRLWHAAATTRLFFLSKGGPIVHDSRRASGLAASITLEEVRPAPDGCAEVRVRVRNTGRCRWLPSDGGRGAVRLGVHERDAADSLVIVGAALFPLPGEGVDPGESTVVEARVPPPAPGNHLVLDLSSDGVAWFSRQGTTPVPIPAAPPSVTAPTHP